MTQKLTFMLLLVNLLGFVESNAQNLPQIYVHTDRSIYSPGDTVWFKAYIMSEGQLNPSVKNLYIDWADSSGRVLENNVYIASEGYSLGQYIIPETYGFPFLYLNAYTGNIQDKGYLGYTKSLHILTDFQRESLSGTNEKLMVIRPQGNQLVKGLNNTIAMRSEQRNGIFLYKAELLDVNYDVLTSVVSDSSGLASLDFVPEDSKYAIRWDDGRGTVKVEALPSVRPEGIVMDVIGQDGNRIVALRPTAGISGDYVLKARLNQEILFEQQLRLDGKALNVAIPDDILSYGLLQLDLQDNNGESYAQCAEVVQWDVVSVVPEVQVVVSDKGPRALQKIRISFPEGVTEANLSVSITDVFSLPDSSDTMTKAVLAAQMTCPVEPVGETLTGLWTKTVPWNSDYTAIDTVAALADSPLVVRGQLLMSDKSWERFERTVRDTKKKGEKSFVPADAVSIGYRPVVQDTVMYPFQYTHAVPDADRKITLEGLQFFDTMEFRLSHIERKLQFEDLEADYMFKPFRDHVFMNVPSCHLKDSREYVDRAVAHMKEIDISFANYLRNSRQIETVVVQRKVKPLAVREMEDKFGVSDWFKNSRETYLPQEDPYVIKYSANLKDYLFRQFIRMGQFKRIYLNEVLVSDYLNGDRILETDRMRWKEALEQDMSWIGLVKVLDGAYGDELAVYQFAPSDVNRDLGRKIQFNKVMGYSPIYDIKNILYSSDTVTTGRNDRQTLYWHPLLLKDVEDKGLDIEFSNNDFGRGYWITIKGVTADGRLVDYNKKVGL